MFQGLLFPIDAQEPRWRRCCRITELTEGKGLAVVVDGEQIALFLLDGHVEAIEGLCPHANAPLARGWIDSAVVVCPLHRWKFDVRSGRYLTSPDRSLRHYRTMIDDLGTVWVETAESAGGSDRSE